MWSYREYLGPNQLLTFCCFINSLIINVFSISLKYKVTHEREKLRSILLIII